MEINEIKHKIEFLHDALYQAGFDLGWETALEELEQQADKLWNKGETVTGEAIRKLLKEVRYAVER